jgi:hypothetical protein
MGKKDDTNERKEEQEMGKHNGSVRRSEKNLGTRRIYVVVPKK